MKYIIAIMIIGATLYGSVKEELFNLYQSQEYGKACRIGVKYIHLYNKDEQYVSLYAFSCLKSDYIDRLAVPISMLKHSKEARANSAYFSTILMQKKLLYHALLDGYDLSNITLPTTDYVLSKVFDLYAKDDHIQKRDLYVYRDRTSPGVTYKLYIQHSGQIRKMVIEEYYDTIMAHRHIYW